MKLRLPDESHLNVYAGKDRSGRTQKFGQRYYMVLVQIGDDEMPQQADETPKPRKLSQIAGALCNDPNFRAWASHTYGDPFPDAEAAAQLIRDTCGVASRRDLDTNEAAAKLFKEILSDYDKAKPND